MGEGGGGVTREKALRTYAKEARLPIRSFCLGNECVFSEKSQAQVASKKTNLNIQTVMKLSG